MSAVTVPTIVLDLARIEEWSDEHLRDNDSDSDQVASAKFAERRRRVNVRREAEERARKEAEEKRQREEDERKRQKREEQRMRAALDKAKKEQAARGKRVAEATAEESENDTAGDGPGMWRPGPDSPCAPCDTAGEVCRGETTGSTCERCRRIHQGCYRVGAKRVIRKRKAKTEAGPSRSSKKTRREDSSEVEVVGERKAGGSMAASVVPANFFEELLAELAGLRKEQETANVLRERTATALEKIESFLDPWWDGYNQPDPEEGDPLLLPAEVGEVFEELVGLADEAGNAREDRARERAESAEEAVAEGGTVGGPDSSAASA